MQPDSTQKTNDIQVCREIVKQIVEYGVTQDQILTIMHLLSYEILAHEDMQKISAVLREILHDKKFLFVDSMEDGDE